VTDARRPAPDGRVESADPGAQLPDPYGNGVRVGGRLGGVRESAAGDPGAHGFELTLEIPLFDWGGAKVARAEAVYMQSVNRLAEAAVNARSEARESYADYREAYQLARHYQDEVLPLRRQISQETLLRYNGMLMSAFELLAEAREQANAVRNTIAAMQDFWIADTNLDAALGGKTK